MQGLLPAAEISALEEHLDRCERCAGLVIELAEVLVPGGAAAPSRTIGRYRLLEALGSGAMGAVYAAYDAELDRRVALKLLRPDTGADREAARERLLAEARALARLQHPNVVAVHDAGREGDEVYVAMELVAGRTLGDWIAAEGPTWQRTVRAHLEAARGLAAAHRAGLVHRDVKPRNLLVGDGGRVRVADFGLAGAEREPGVAGTPAYMAPEQHAGAPADARSDQFGLAVSLYEALHGHRPFAGDSGAEVARSARAGVIRGPGHRAVPGRVLRVVVRALSAAPDDRFRTMDDFADALEGAIGAGRRRELISAAAIAGAAVVVVVPVLWWATSRDDEAPGPVVVAEHVARPASIADAETATAQLDRAQRLLDRGDGAGCLEALAAAASLTVPGVQQKLIEHTRALCTMRAGDCDAGQAALRGWFTRWEAPPGGDEPMRSLAAVYCQPEDAEGAERLLRAVSQANLAAKDGRCARAEELARMARAVAGEADRLSGNPYTSTILTAGCRARAGDCEAAWALWLEAYRFQFATDLAPAELEATARQTFGAAHASCAADP